VKQLLVTEKIALEKLVINAKIIAKITKTDASARVPEASVEKISAKDPKIHLDLGSPETKNPVNAE
jgi:hypothetical protein